MIKIRKVDANYIYNYALDHSVIYKSLMDNIENIAKVMFDDFKEELPTLDGDNTEHLGNRGLAAGKAYLQYNLDMYHSMMVTFCGSKDVEITEYDADKFANFIRKDIKDNAAVNSLEKTEKDKQEANQIYDIAVSGMNDNFKKMMENGGVDPDVEKMKILEILMVGSVGGEK